MRKASSDYPSISNSIETNTEIPIQISKSNPEAKKIDKEHVTLERIFRISLQESDKFVYLELYHAQLLSQDKEIAFRMDNLDDIVINIINHPERVRIIINPLLSVRRYSIIC